MSSQNLKFWCTGNRATFHDDSNTCIDNSKHTYFILNKSCRYIRKEQKNMSNKCWKNMNF